MNESIQKLLDAYPFLTYGEMLDTPYLGIVQNCDQQLISIYVLTDIPTMEMRKHFLRLGYTYWWESSRTTPINIFLKEQFAMFRPFLKHFSRKDFNLISGPIVSLQETISRRVRKRQVQLVRRLPD